MRKIIKRFVLAVMLVFMFGLLGCGATLTTDMSISDSFSGTRTMDVSISQADFEEYTQEADFETLAAETKEITPECMQFSYEETKDGTYIFHFVMPFSSKEDYEKKVVSVLGEGYTTEFVYSQIPFAEGVTFTEDFSSADLLSWFKEYLIKKNYVSSDYSSYIFEYTDNTVTINGKEYESNLEKLKIKQETYVQIEELNIFTDIDAEKAKIARKIEVVFQQSILENNREKVDSYLSGVTPEGCQGEWIVTEDGLEKYVLTIPACSPDEMTLLMQNFCASTENSVQLVVAGEDVSVKTKEAENEEDNAVSNEETWNEEVLGDISFEKQVDSSVYVQPFGYESTIYENLDLSSFVCDSWGEIESAYYISVKNGKPESKIYFPNGEEAYGWDYIQETQPDYYFIESEWTPSYQVVSTVNKYYLPTSTQINTVVKSEDKITREFVFKFDTPFDKMVLERIEAKLENLFDAHKDVISLKYKNTKKNTSITWKMEGTVEEVDTLCEEIFGMGHSDISYYCQDKFTLKQQYDYQEAINLSPIFDWEYSGNIDYTLKLPGKINKNQTSISGGVSANEDIRSSKINYLVTESGYLNARVVGEKTNAAKVILIIVILAFLLGVCGGIVLLLCKMAK